MGRGNRHRTASTGQLHLAGRMGDPTNEHLVAEADLPAPAEELVEARIFAGG